MNVFERPQGLALERLRQRHSEIEEVETLLRPAAGQVRVPASRLYAAAAEDDNEPAIEALLSESRSARAFHRRSVAASALYSLPQARAASSGAALARHGDGCKIRTERSRAEPDQFFVLVEVEKSDRKAPPTSLVVCDSQDRVRRFPLPAVREGVAQMIAEADSDLLRLISDPTTKVYLR